MYIYFTLLSFMLFISSNLALFFFRSFKQHQQLRQGQEKD